ncbi:glycine--tRNA ligase alpha subunit [Striga asiatica]|uniref:Glycine--tRNA ligase alpha subunit n=1 Tax=Striga asiatica TaxID=4170 RepID=A0A5A7PLI0_STRAF|nr:glycine--tRNA ligase alpha subunit [Striga asiatica]
MGRQEITCLIQDLYHLMMPRVVMPEELLPQGIEAFGLGLNLWLNINIILTPAFPELLLNMRKVSFNLQGELSRVNLQWDLFLYYIFKKNNKVHKSTTTMITNQTIK